MVYRKGMATIGVSLRYHAKSDTYYIQMQGVQYALLDKKIRRLKTRMARTQKAGNTKEGDKLTEYYRWLLQEKRQSQCYIMVPASDLPKNVRARPIYDLPGKIVTVDPQRYAELLDRIQGSKSEGDES